MNGWIGKVLRVDLTLNEIKEELLDPKIARDYIGGRGLGVYYLNKELDPRADPFSPENLLIMATGPLTGTKTPTGARYMVMTKSPLTGSITCSNSGGMFPAELKRAGFDAVLFTGRAAGPVYLWINRGQAELRRAEHIWGRTVPETTDTLVNELDPKAKVACIGPAGENLVLFASIMNDKHRAAARSGVGAVMGSKNLKAVVVRGNNKVPLADEDRFREHNAKVLTAFKEKNNPPVLRVYGTSHGVGGTQHIGNLPTRNFQEGTFDNWEKINSEALREQYLVKPKYCYACPIGCGRGTKVDVPGFEGEGEGPEYETIYAFGPNCMNDNLASVVKAGYLCNELGMDTMSMGATIACAMELYERGHLSEEAIGAPLKWGDAEAIVALTLKTAYRRDFGDLLAQGSYRLAEHCGHPEYAMVSKKQEFAGYDTRGEQGMGLAYATSPVGASHMRGHPAYFEIFGVPFLVDPQVWADKARVIKCHQDVGCIIDSLGICYFFGIRNLVEPVLEVPPAGMLEYINIVTGAEYTLEELSRAGERIFNAERQFMVKAGFSRRDDSLPPRQLEEAVPEGPAKGLVCHLNEMLEEYYQARGWTTDGLPTEEKLKALGLI